MDDHKDVIVGGYDVKHNDRVLGIWFVYGSFDADWMAWVWKLAEDASYRFVYRFRYYTDSTRTESGEVVWKGVRVSPEKPEADMVAFVTGIANELVEGGFNEKLDHVEVYGSPDKAMRLMTKRPWCHMKPESDA